MTENPMRKIRIEKVVLNIGCNREKDPTVAAGILEKITGVKTVVTRTHRRTTFGVAKDRPIGARVTIRKNTEELLKRLFEAIGNKIKKSSITDGTFSFGVPEYITIPGIRYDPNIPIMGLDVCVTLKRPGFRVKRKALKRKIGKKHKITKEETVDFVRNLGIKIEEDK